VIYELSIPVEFPCPPQVVYDALTDLGSYPKWTEDMTHVSTKGPMRQGLQFTTETVVLGRVNRSDITVQVMVPQRLIVLKSNTGLVSFLARYNITDMGGGTSRVTCNVQLSFSKAVFNLALPVAQAVAETRIRGDLENLRDRISRSDIEQFT
jgi:uncharacterized protein YndB with AHSA1/START domain